MLSSFCLLYLHPAFFIPLHPAFLFPLHPRRTFLFHLNPAFLFYLHPAFFIPFHLAFLFPLHPIPSSFLYILPSFFPLHPAFLFPLHPAFFLHFASFFLFLILILHIIYYIYATFSHLCLIHIYSYMLCILCSLLPSPPLSTTIQYLLLPWSNLCTYTYVLCLSHALFLSAAFPLLSLSLPNSLSYFSISAPYPTPIPPFPLPPPYPPFPSYFLCGVKEAI